ATQPPHHCFFPYDDDARHLHSFPTRRSSDLEQPGPPADVPPGTPLILLSPHAEMTTGKAMAQAAHAAQLGWRSLGRRDRRRWVDADLRLAVRDAEPEQWQAEVDRGMPVVHDG